MKRVIGVYLTGFTLAAVLLGFLLLPPDFSTGWTLNLTLWLLGLLLWSSLWGVLFFFQRRGRFDKIKGWSRVAYSLLLSLGPPLFIYRTFGADGPVALLIGTALALNLFAYAAALGLGSLFSDLLRRLFYLAAAVLIISGLIITPLSAYLAWFDILRGSGTGGLIPFVFSMICGFFSVAFGTAIYKRSVLLPTLGTAAVTLLLMAVILQSVVVGIAALLGAAVALSLLFLASFSSERRERSVVSPVTGLILAFAIAVPAALITNVDGSLFIDRHLSPWVKNQTSTLMPDFPFLYTMPGYGFRMNEKRLGGRPALSERAIFRVKGRPGETLYLRTRIFDAYTGQGWGISEGLLEQVTAEERDYFRRSSADERLEVEVLIDFTNTLPHTLDTSHFRTADSYPTRFSSLETGFVLEDPILRGEVLRIERRRGRTDSPTLRPYLAVPNSLPDEVRDLARQLGSGLQGEPEKVLSNIATYLAENASYSLDVGYADAEVDSTWDFLFNSKTGYCTNFATAYVILARLNGIPARYATGFLVFMPFDDGETFVTGYASHAWPEIWLQDQGWRAREATPPMNPEFMEEYFYFGAYGSEMSGSTSRQLEGMLGDRAPAPAETEVQSEEAPRIAFLLPAIVGLILALVLLLGKKRMLRLVPTGDPRLRAERRLQRIVRLTREPGIPGPEAAGWQRWSRETARRRTGEEAELILGSAEIALRGFFGPTPPEREDIIFLDRAKKELRRKRGA